MGLLDDAIREHLELKRRRGADPRGGRAPGARGARARPRERRAATASRSPSRRPRRRAAPARTPAGASRPRRGAAEPASPLPSAAAEEPVAPTSPRRPSAASPQRRAVARRARRGPGRRRARAPPSGRAERRPGRRSRPSRARGRGRARGDAGLPAGDAGARPALVRAEAAARLRLRRVARGCAAMAHRFTWLDVFTAERLDGQRPRGRPRRRRPRRRRRCTRFARETRLSETSFVQAPTADGADYRHRICMPTGEIPFAGHPSLGHGRRRRARPRRAARRPTSRRPRAGLQPIDVEVDGDRARASMLQEPAQFGDELDPEDVLGAVGLEGADARPRPAAAVRLHRRAAAHRAGPRRRRRSAALLPDYDRIGALLAGHAAHRALPRRTSTRPPGARAPRSFIGDGRGRRGSGHRLGGRAAVALRRRPHGRRAARRSSRASRWAAASRPARRASRATACASAATPSSSSTARPSGRLIERSRPDPKVVGVRPKFVRRPPDPAREDGRPAPGLPFSRRLVLAARRRARARQGSLRPGRADGTPRDPRARSA